MAVVIDMSHEHSVLCKKIVSRKRVFQTGKTPSSSYVPDSGKKVFEMDENLFWEIGKYHCITSSQVKARQGLERKSLGP